MCEIRGRREKSLLDECDRKMNKRSMNEECEVCVSGKESRRGKYKKVDNMATEKD